MLLKILPSLLHNFAASKAIVFGLWFCGYLLVPFPSLELLILMWTLFERSFSSSSLDIENRRKSKDFLVSIRNKKQVCSLNDTEVSKWIRTECTSPQLSSFLCHRFPPKILWVILILQLRAQIHFSCRHKYL